MIKILKKVCTPFIVLGVIVTLSLSSKTSLNGTQTLLSNSLKVMTINVWSGLDYIGTFKMGEYETPQIREKRYQALLKEIANLNPDIIAINEANFLPDYIKRLANDLNYDYIYHVGVAGLKIGRCGIPTNLKEGDGLLARKQLQLKQVRQKKLSGGGIITNCFSFHTQDATQVLVGRIMLNDKPVFVAVTHWHASPFDTPQNRTLLKELKDTYGYSDDEYNQAIQKLEADNEWRKNESIAMAEFLKKVVPDNAPCIVMGDFNTTLDSPEMRYFLSQGYHDTFLPSKNASPYTWNPMENANIKKYYVTDTNTKFDSLYAHCTKINDLQPKTIDYILTNSVIPLTMVHRSTVCCTTLHDGYHPSDHFGVFAEILIQ